MRVIAEGIETESQLNVLTKLGCDYGQGYLMSRPLAKDVMEELLHKKQFWLPTSKAEDQSSHQTNSPQDEIIAVF